MKKPEVDWTFLDKVNTTAFKGWSAVWLWIGTFVVWGVALLLAVVLKVELPEGWLGTWLGGLTLYSGVGAFQYKAMRETDYGALERKAKAAAAPHAEEAR